MTKKYAAVAITRGGIRLALALAGRMKDTEVYCFAKYCEDLAEVPGERRVFAGPVKALLPELFRRYEGLILFFSLGAAVRLIAPLLQHKTADPAVVVIDERGEHVISMLSGHLGGANRLTLRIAELLGSHPVITTASDVQGSFAVDLLGREFGWQAEPSAPLKAVSAALVNGGPLAIVQTCGERDWLPPGARLPEHAALFTGLAEMAAAGTDWAAAIVITDRVLSAGERALLPEQTVIYRPRSLVLGLGCNRGSAAAELEAVAADTLAGLGLSLRSVRNVATASIKGDEAGLLALCAKYGWELQLYTPEELNRVTLAAPSDVVFRATGAYGVCEPAALLSAGAAELVQPKLKSGNVTVAVARIPWTDGEEPCYECD
ncbi:cobalt-precorrin 5A hydrolase [Paenibacillus tengchongensis]|uniref:cobalt-precorrin 5A hydrolase n=1 Tax=Paenibacillus tengchongensis TaxID=2608684 RepID=UPI00124CDF80|nr:cobalamin biosynthesis protein [Paenibacillus tengchongensis]